MNRTYGRWSRAAALGVAAVLVMAACGDDDDDDASAPAATDAPAVTEAPDQPSHIRAFRVDGDALSGGEVFATTVGIPDGLRTDRDGNIWTTAGPAVNCYTPQGELIGRVHYPENVSNLTFAGNQRLFATGWSRVYSLWVAVAGAQYP